MDETKRADERVPAGPESGTPCAVCGAPVRTDEDVFVLMGPTERPVCQACMQKRMPELLYASRTALIMAGEDHRSELLWDLARRRPRTFWEYELFTRERGGPGGAPLAKDALVELDYRAELLDAEGAVTVMIPHGVAAEQAADLVEMVADVIREGGYPTFLRDGEGRRG